MRLYTNREVLPHVVSPDRVQTPRKLLTYVKTPSEEERKELVRQAEADYQT